MKKICPEKLNSTIHALCPDVWKQFQQKSKNDFSENDLWEELVCCILGSQVKYEVSKAAVKNLKQNDLLDIYSVNNFYEEYLKNILNEPLKVNSKYIKYRFPNSKAKQISLAWKNIYGYGYNIKKILNNYNDPFKLRDTLIKLVPGLGMKQASMFLRNISQSYDLAVIDSHVLKYMNIINISDNFSTSINKTQYLNKEKELVKHTKIFNYPVGCVDYAIWIVMRVAGKEGYI